MEKILRRGCLAYQIKIESQYVKFHNAKAMTERVAVIIPYREAPRLRTRQGHPVKFTPEQ